MSADDTPKNPDVLWVALEGENVPIRLDDPGDTHFIPDGRLVVRDHPASLAAEQFRLLYLKLLQGTQDRSSYTLAITSAVKEEGKTFTALNLAMTMARDFDQRVLFLEGDMKRPSLHTYLDGRQGLGLTDVLEGRATPEACWIDSCRGRLQILPVGRVVEHSSRLLSSPSMESLLQRMRERYRHIVIDTPPILPLADMNIFSQWVDGILLVVRAGMTPRSLVKRAVASLGSGKIIGTVLNGIQPSFSKYYDGTYPKDNA